DAILGDGPGGPPRRAHAGARGPSAFHRLQLRIGLVGLRQLLRDAEGVHARLDRVLQFLHALEAIFLLLLQALEDDLLELLGDLRLEAARRRRSLLQMADQHLAEIAPWKRQLTDCELV